MSHPEATVRTRTALDADAVGEAVTRMANQLVADLPDLEQLGLIGLPTRGVPLARRLAARLSEQKGSDFCPLIGQMDITFHRDDLSLRRPAPHITDVPFDVNGRTILLVDDVIFTGRSTRAALDALHDLGRPQRILLAALIDRGHRMLPLHADFVGATIETRFEETIYVKLKEVDGTDAVEVSVP
ncbi:MAG: bifunctional pyr operon transcriptional regulator/uracil phosphoribosyltransferase PyrR [Verrucomicrobiota bacterium]